MHGSGVCVVVVMVGADRFLPLSLTQETASPLITNTGHGSIHVCAS